MSIIETKINKDSDRYTSNYDHHKALSDDLNNKIKKKGGQLRLSNINPQIYEVFAITKLNKLFQIHENNEKAMGSFK